MESPQNERENFSNDKLINYAMIKKEREREANEHDFAGRKFNFNYFVAET